MNASKPRLVRYATPAGPCWGVLAEKLYELHGDLYARWKTGPEVGEVGSVTLLPPVAPSKIVGVGRNYAAHAAEHEVEVPAEPLLFLKPPSAVIGPDQPILLPQQSGRVEHEAELALVIGRRCRNVSPESAWAYVLGVSCANDVTARDLQRRDGQWARAKGFDTFCPVGPWLIPGVSEAEVANLVVTCRVNGEVRQAGRTSEMVFAPTELIAYAAAAMTLNPGDLLLTGTPAGVGQLQAGDVVEVEIEGIGLLRNPVQAAPR
ncbi:MAG: fumarylacetoacetate hydrolase family protein [Anaerolineae bacterium]|nr:fumarylacetoacetate hydrolase family protein [Anaerolineae bacterium]